MAVSPKVDEQPEAFRLAVASLRQGAPRAEVVLDEAPAPQRLAPHAAAISADVVVEGEEVASGRLVLLHDPAGHESWQGVFRLVTYVRAELEPEMAVDPMLPAVGWAWLLESLDGLGLGYRAESGTVTRVASESFGAMAGRPASADIEVRASWTAVAVAPEPAGPAAAGSRGALSRPAQASARMAASVADPVADPVGASMTVSVPDLGAHLEAWAQMLCTIAGLPPVAPGVSMLSDRRRR